MINNRMCISINSIEFFNKNRNIFSRFERTIKNGFIREKCIRNINMCFITNRRSIINNINIINMNSIINRFIYIKIRNIINIKNMWICMYIR